MQSGRLIVLIIAQFIRLSVLPNIDIWPNQKLHIQDPREIRTAKRMVNSSRVIALVMLREFDYRSSTEKCVTSIDSRQRRRFYLTGARRVCIFHTLGKREISGCISDAGG